MGAVHRVSQLQGGNFAPAAFFKHLAGYLRPHVNAGVFGGVFGFAEYFNRSGQVKVFLLHDHLNAGMIVFGDFPEFFGSRGAFAHVDFFALTMAATRGGAAPKGITTQGNFLRSLGIQARADNLKKTASAEQKAIIDRSVSRLCDEDQMGSLFKVLSLGDKDSPSMIGF